MGAVWSKATARPLALARSFDLMLAPAKFPLSLLDHQNYIKRTIPIFPAYFPVANTKKPNGFIINHLAFIFVTPVGFDS